MAVNCENPLPNGDPCCECAVCRGILAGTNPDIKEIAAAEDNGVSMAKKLSEDVSYSPVASKVKVYILDEAHALSGACWQVLLKVLEEAPEYCMFIMCTTEISKVPLPVRSRSLICNFYKLQMDEIAEYVRQVSKAEDRELSIDSAKVIAKQSEGSMRNALGILEKVLACSSEDEEMTVESVKSISGLGNSETEMRILECLLKGAEGDFVRELTLFAEAAPLDNFLSDLLAASVDAAVLKAGGNVFGWSAYIERLRQLIDTTSLDKLIKLSATLVPLVSKKETLASVVLGEMFLAFKEINMIPSTEQCDTVHEVKAATVADTVTSKTEETSEPATRIDEIKENVATAQNVPQDTTDNDVNVKDPLPIRFDNAPVKEDIAVDPEPDPEPKSQATVSEQTEDSLENHSRTISDIEEEIRTISAKDKLFKWFFLPARKIYYEQERLKVLFRREDEPIAMMLQKAIRKQAVSYIDVSFV